MNCTSWQASNAANHGRRLQVRAPIAAVVAATLLLCGGSTHSAPGDVLSTVKPLLDLRADEQVGASAVDAQGRHVVAVNRTEEPFLIRSARLLRLSEAGAVDSAFVSPAFDDHVHVVLPVGGDALYVGGRFLTAGGTSRSGVVRLTGEGRVDPAFQPAAPGGLRYVNALATDAQGGVLVGGWFNQWDGRAVAEFVRLKPDGSLDLPFMINAPAPDPSSRVSVAKVEVLPDARVALLSAGLTVLKPDGTLDLRLGSEHAVTAWSALPGGGWILVENVQTTGAPFRVRVRRLNTAGEEDLAWRREYAIDGSVTHLIRSAEGGYWLAGAFTSLGGRRHEGVARLGDDGSLDGGWVAKLSAASGGEPDSWATWGLTALLNSVRELPGGGLEWVGLLRDSSGGYGWSVVHLDGGRVGNGPPAIGVGTREVTVKEGEKVRLGFEVESALPFSSAWFRQGVAVVRGLSPVLEFTEPAISDAGEYRLVVSNALGSASSPAVTLRVDWAETAPGSRDLGFRALAMSPTPETVRPFMRVSGLEVRGSEIYVASEAYWATDPASELPVAHASPWLSRLGPEGAADPSFVMLRGAPEAARLRAVNRFLPLRDGRVLADLELAATAPGMLSERRLVRVGIDGALDTGFRDPLIRQTPFTRVSALLETSEGGFLVGGLFQGNQPQESWAVVKLRSDGTIDDGFRPVLGSANATALALQTDGRWLAGLEGVGVRRFLADGTPDPGFVTAVQPQAALRLLTVDHADRVLVAVPLGDPKQVYPDQLVRLLPDGAVDSSFAGFERRDAEVSVGIHRVMEQTDGRLVVVLSGMLGSGPQVIRLNEDGTLDESFRLLLDLGGVDEVRMTATGQILMSKTQFGANYGFRTALVRVNATDERRLKLARLADGRIEGRVSTRVGRRYELERSTASVGAPWVPVMTWNGDGRDRTFTEGLDGSEAFFRLRLAVP